MAALLNRSETEFQRLVIEGPPPLGPGAPAIERLHAFGHSRMEVNLQHAELIRAAGRAGERSYAAVSFAAMHVRYLLSELGVRGDIAFLATALLSPLEMVVLVQQTREEAVPLERVQHGWEDLVRRDRSCAASTSHPVGIVTSRAGAGRARARRPRSGRRGRAAAPPQRAGRRASRRPAGRPRSRTAGGRRPASRSRSRPRSTA